jgi:hypothetical protein
VQDDKVTVSENYYVNICCYYTLIVYNINVGEVQLVHEAERLD